MKKKLSEIITWYEEAFDALYSDQVIQMQTIPWKYCTWFMVVVMVEWKLMAFDIWEHEEYWFIDAPDWTWWSRITMNTVFDLYEVKTESRIFYSPIEERD